MYADHYPKRNNQASSNCQENNTSQDRNRCKKIPSSTFEESSSGASTPPDTAWHTIPMSLTRHETLSPTLPVEIRTTIHVPPSVDSSLNGCELEAAKIRANHSSIAEQRLPSNTSTLQLHLQHLVELKIRNSEPISSTTHFGRTCRSAVDWKFGIPPLITVTPPLHSGKPKSPHTAVQWVCDRIPVITVTNPPDVLSLSSLMSPEDIIACTGASKDLGW